MKTKYIIMTALALLIYYCASYYVGWRLFETIQSVIPAGYMGYWTIYIALSTSYLLGRIGQVFFPGKVSNGLIWIGAYWLGMFFYLFLTWALFDLMMLIARGVGLHTTSIYSSPAAGFMILGLVGFITVYGAWNARNPHLRQYQVVINKFCQLRELNIIMVSDLHLGILIGKKRLEQLIDRINALHPDLVLLPGDILDENVGVFLDNHMQEVFRRLHPPLGVFGCLGSHEYIWGDSEKAVNTLQLAGIQILRDQYEKVADSFYIVGRDDYYRERLVDIPRRSLGEIVASCDKSLPIIMLDHYPADLDEGRLQGIDLQLSGHTHNGQLYPLNLLTRSSFELSQGYLQRGNFHAIVSSGFGTWLPPIRVGTKPEIVSTQVTFQPNR